MSELDERIKTYSTAFAAVAVPIVVALIGSWFSAAIKQSESEQKFVSLAIEILRDEPVESQKQLRAWATDVVSKYSGVSLANAREDLIENIRLPVSTENQPSQSSAYTPIEPIDGKSLCGEENTGMAIFPNQTVRFSESKSVEGDKNVSNLVFDYFNYCSVLTKEVDEATLPLQYRRMGSQALVGVGIRISIKYISNDNIPQLSNLLQAGVYADEGKINGSIQVSTIGVVGKKISNILPMPRELSANSVQDTINSIAIIKELVFSQEVTISPRIFALTK